MLMLRPSTMTSSSSSSRRKSLATCTVSLAHAEVVVVDKSSQHTVNCGAQLSNRNLIPFPTLPPAISARPLPLPPTPHALLRSSRMTTEFDFAIKRARKSSLSPLSPKPKVAAPPAPSMQRRRSRDPNIADRLVVELDDDDHTHSIHPRPSSPSPDSNEQKSLSDMPTSPDPPAYSTLPPPYSATTDEKKDASFSVVVEKEEDQPSPNPNPSPQPSTSSSSSSSSTSHKRSRVSTSELRVLVYLYRTVVYGLEMRNRKEKESELFDAPRSTTSSTIPAKKKPLGPRSSRAAGSLPEDIFHFETALAAASAKASKHSAGGFAQFPLVEEDLDSAGAKEYSTPRTPFHSPSQSPRSTPSFLRSSPSLDEVASHFAPKPKKEKTKAEINAELHVQDALLALRLKEFLRAQGVCEDDLKVDFDDEGRVVEPQPEEVLVAEEIKKECVAPVHEEADEENNILDEYFMGIEEVEEPTTKKDRGPVVEDDDVVLPKLDSPFVEEDDLDMDMGDSSPSPPTPTPSAPLQVATLAQRISSPPPASPSPRPHAVLPTSYMVALLTMRVRHPSKKPGSSSSSNGNGTSTNGGGIADKGKDSKVKRKSGLSVVVEVD